MTRKKKSYLTDKKVQEKLASQERELAAFEKQDLRDVLSTECGRRFYYRVVYELCSIEEDNFDYAESPSLAYMARVSGIQWAGRKLLEEAQAHVPDLWQQMIKERLVRRDTIVAQREKTKEGEDQ